MILSFELTMPNVGSWNGRWTGAGRKYFAHRNMKNDKATKAKIAELLQGEESRGFYHNFGDGWGAMVTMRIVDAATRGKERRVSAGFCGYEWMIDNILEYGKTRDNQP